MVIDANDDVHIAHPPCKQHEARYRARQRPDPRPVFTVTQTARRSERLNWKNGLFQAPRPKCMPTPRIR